MKDILKPVEDIQRKSQSIRDEEINVEKKVEIHLRRVAKYINSSSEIGSNKTSILILMSNEFKYKDEIYDRVIKEI